MSRLRELGEMGKISICGATAFLTVFAVILNKYKYICSEQWHNKNTKVYK